ncbi:kinesin light chain 1 [Xylaria telfairii]|nr:kinesin light chain 1 [Xylaria telfairii]
MRGWIQKNKKWERWITKGVQHLSSKYPWPKHENKEIGIRILPHAQIAVEFKIECTDKRSMCRLLMNMAESYRVLEKYEEAESALYFAVELRMQTLGVLHSETLAAMNNLAVVLAIQGKRDEAEQMHLQTLKSRKKLLGEKHPDTLDSMNNVAIALQDQKRYHEAEQRHRTTLKLRGEVLGSTHPKRLIA